MNRKGLDGNIYNNYADLEEANARYLSEQNEEQRYILEQQMQQQNVLLENKMEEQKNTFKEIEKERQSHEEQMRILKLFDDIGIHKDLFDKFIDYMLVTDMDTLEIEKENKRVNEIVTKYKEINFEYEEINKNKESADTFKAVVELFKEIKNDFRKNKADCIDYINHGTDSQKSMMRKVINHQKIAKKIPLALIIISLVILIGFLKYFLIIPIIIFLVIKMEKTLRDKIATEIDKELNEIVKLVGMYEEKTNSEKENKILNERQKLISEYTEIETKVIQKRVNDFEKFRLNNYNSKIEKILLDLKIPERFKEESYIEFNSITSKQAKNNGDIDDYISYFQEKIR